MRRYGFPLLIACAMLTSCASKRDAEPQVATSVPSSTITERSIYNIESVWKDQHGRDVKLSELAGKPRIAAMFYSTCTYACPKTIADMKALLHALPAASQDKVGMTLFSFDPDRDTPQRLDSVAKERELNDDHWLLLTSTASAAQELGAAVDVQYKGQTDGEFSHSNVILILNAAGEVVHRQEGISADPTASLEVLRKLTE